MYRRLFYRFAACVGIGLTIHATCPEIVLPLVGSAYASAEISFPLPPADVQSANEARPKRRDAVITFLACAQEVKFLSHLIGQNPIPDEGINAIVMAKMAWLGQFTSFDDQSLRRQRCMNSITLEGNDPQLTSFLTGGIEAARARLRAFDRTCDLLTSVTDEDGGKKTLAFEVNGLCMRNQINQMIMILTAPNHLGTSGLPCISGGIADTAIPPIIPHGAPEFTVEGELDVNVRDFTRMFFLNKNRSILDEATRNHIRDNLLIAWGPVGPESYSILDCGNSEHSEGTPQELLDERDFLDEAADELGDAGLWLAKRLAFLALLFNTPLATLAGQLLQLIGSGAAIPGVVASPTLAAAVATVGLGEIRIGETENHRLMIESSRFLKNQIILEDAAGHPNIDELQDDQNELKVWLLDYMGEIMRHDFAEYNARPYQRYSLVAMLNLADFATDVEVRRGARMVLEFALAKFAVASREGIRVAPYRRLVEHMNRNPYMFDFGGEGSDHPIAMMLVYAGQSQRLGDLPAAIAEDRSTKILPYGSPGGMIFAATSTFAPDNSILDIAIDKSQPYFQRLHSDGVEIYTNTKSFTIAAGGIKTDQVLTLMFGPIETGIGNTTDLGTGVPTSFIPSGTFHLNRLKFMRFEGVVEDIGDVDPITGFGADGRINDHNLCVWEGFACGLNYQDAENLDMQNDPGGMAGCFKPGPTGAPPEWSFLDSKECKATQFAPPFFIARYLLPCTNRDSGCLTNGRFGFFEAVDAPAVTFGEFQQQVLASNPVIFPGNPNPFDAVNQNGHYQMFGGNRDRILFSVVANRADPDLSGVLSVGLNPVPKISDWPFAQGQIINSSGNGVVTFTNPKLGTTITWDFSDARRPKRTPAND